jgi:hypothetical protein
MRSQNQTALRTTSALLTLVIYFSLVVQTEAQQALDRREFGAIERDTVALLLKNDLHKLIAQLSERATTAAPLLRQLVLFARADQPDGVRGTLEQLSEASDWQSAENSSDVRALILKSIGDDLAAWRIYYERLYPHNSDGAETFVRLWDRVGDAKEIDPWLEARSTGFDDWFRVRLSRRVKLGTAAELLEPFAAAVRSNPGDLNAARRYSQANNWARNLQDISWLADVCTLKGAAENYELARLLSAFPANAARLLQKSLTLPFTERDDAEMRNSLGLFSLVQRNLNHEKQLRFWTRSRLADAYLALKRPQDAQPLIEELMAMKGDDILAEDVERLAGSVQRESGQRVVEKGILQNEASLQRTGKYWLERASYYRGRSEDELERETYLKALAALPAPVNDQAVAERLEVLRTFAFSVDRDREDGGERQRELESVLRREFINARPETSLAFYLARTITNDDLKLDSLRRSLFVTQPRLVARILGARAEWGNEERYLVEGILRGDEITPTEKNAIWNALEQLVKDPESMRAYQLAEAMVNCGELERAAPLWIGYLKSEASNDYVDRDEIIRHVVDAYCKKGDWKLAEELLFSNMVWSWKSLPRHLGTVAASAASQGAPADAMRLWRLKVNLDRRDLTGLEQLSHSQAKTQLREFYLQLKKDDPKTNIPETALRLL